MTDNDEKKGIIIVHQFPRGKNAPSPSPYPIKLETFLRMNKIPFEAGNVIFISSKKMLEHLNLSKTLLGLFGLNEKLKYNP